MPHDENKLTPADPHDLPRRSPLLCGSSEEQAHRDADAFRAVLAAERVVRHLDRAGFVVMNFQSTTFGAGRDCEGSARPTVITVRS
jgi:hypothetical protein